MRKRSLSAFLLAVLLLTLVPLGVWGHGTSTQHGVGDFGDQTGYVEVADNATLDFGANTDFTLEAWVYRESSGSLHIIFDKREAVGSDGYLMGIHNDNKVHLYLNGIAGTKEIIGATTVTLLTWHHVAGVFDRSGNGVIYLDGGLDGSGDITGVGDIDNTGRLAIGWHSPDIASAWTYFNGTIDEGRISDTLRYTANFTVPSSEYTSDGNTQGLWHMNEGTGTNTADGSSNSNTGTLTNGPTWITPLSDCSDWWASICNLVPTITTVSTVSDSIDAGNPVVWQIDWNDADMGDQVKAHLCKTDAITTQTCDGGSWTDSAAYTTTDPLEISYTTTPSDLGDQQFFAFICDDDDACSASTSGWFKVTPITDGTIAGPDTIPDIIPDTTDTLPVTPEPAFPWEILGGGTGIALIAVGLFSVNHYQNRINRTASQAYGRVKKRTTKKLDDTRKAFTLPTLNRKAPKKPRNKRKTKKRFW